MRDYYFPTTVKIFYCFWARMIIKLWENKRIIEHLNTDLKIDIFFNTQKCRQLFFVQLAQPRLRITFKAYKNVLYKSLPL